MKFTICKRPKQILSSRKVQKSEMDINVKKGETGTIWTSQDIEYPKMGDKRQEEEWQGTLSTHAKTLMFTQKSIRC